MPDKLNGYGFSPLNILLIVPFFEGFSNQKHFMNFSRPFQSLFHSFSKAKNLNRQFVFPVCCRTKTNLRSANWINALLINNKIKLNTRKTVCKTDSDWSDKLNKVFWNQWLSKCLCLVFWHSASGTHSSLLSLSLVQIFPPKASEVHSSIQFQLNQRIYWPAPNTLN